MIARSLTTMWLVVALVVSLAASVNAGPPIDSGLFIWWDLDSDGVMYKGATHSESGSVTITAGGSYLWRADEASLGVSFPAEAWGGQLKTGSSWTYTVDIGSYNGTTFTSNGATGSEILLSDGGSYWAIAANGFTVPSGDYLALEVTNTASSDMVITTDGSSFVARETGPPAYPVSELSTAILLAAGLGGLTVYLGLRRRKLPLLRRG